MPSHSQVSLDIFAGRENAEGEWDIPLPGLFDYWVVPIATSVGGSPRRVGTAFYFSRTGHLLTARHCIDEALKSDDRGRELATRRQPIRPESQLLVIRRMDDSSQKINALPVLTMVSPEPADAVALCTEFREKAPQVTLPISFALPDVGSTVHCFGFPRGEGELFPAQLHAVEGRVRAYFPPLFSRGYMKGPCFLVEAEVQPGMSGGPVVNSAGAVCGVVSAGAGLFFDEPAYLVTPLYPFVLTNLPTHLKPAVNFDLNLTLPLLELCGAGTVRTDGTEEQVRIRSSEEGIEICPTIGAANHPFVFESFEAYQLGRPSTPIGGAMMRIVMRRRPD